MYTSYNMILYFLVILLIVMAGGFGLKEDCTLYNRVQYRDGVSCYECGLSYLPVFERQFPFKVNGTASPLEFPWHATLFEKTRQGWTQICGGTLITPRAVLTAASCVTFSNSSRPISPRRLQVVFGKSNVLWDFESNSEMRRIVFQIRVHPDYKSGLYNELANNIAVVELYDKVPKAEFLEPACLDFEKNEFPSYQKGDVGFTTGYGYTEQCSQCSDLNETLMYSSTNIMSYKECLDTIIQKGPSYEIQGTSRRLTTGSFCVGNDAVSPIRIGKGGNGVTVIHRGVHYLVGITSARLTSFRSYNITYTFDMVSNVTHYMDWIKNNIPEDD